MTEDNNIVWTKGDQIAVFRGNTYGEKYALSDTYAGSSNGVFNVVTEEGSSFSAGADLGGKQFRQWSLCNGSSYKKH